MRIERIVNLFLFLALLLAAVSSVQAYQDDDFFFDDEIFIDDDGFYFDDEIFIDDDFGTDTDFTDVPSSATEEAAAEEGEFSLEDALANPEKLLAAADEKIFQRVGFSETFWETQGYVNEVLEGEFIHQYYVRSGLASDLLMTMFPASKSMRVTNHWLNIAKGLEQDYHVTFSVLRSEDTPKGSGGCWIRFSNYQTKSRGSESGLILFPEKEAYGFEPVGDGVNFDYTTVGDLSGLSLNNNIKFDFIRLDGVSYIYANGKYLFSYDDGFDGKMSFEAGSELYKGGNRVRCSFDNFSMRYR